MLAESEEELKQRMERIATNQGGKVAGFTYKRKNPVCGENVRDAVLHDVNLPVVVAGTTAMVVVKPEPKWEHAYWTANSKRPPSVKTWTEECGI
jgi:hypothetical protein